MQHRGLNILVQRTLQPFNVTSNDCGSLRLVMLEPGTPGEPEAEAGGAGSSAGGRIARSAIVGRPVASGSAARASARSGART